MSKKEYVIRYPNYIHKYSSFVSRPDDYEKNHLCSLSEYYWLQYLSCCILNLTSIDEITGTTPEGKNFSGFLKGREVLLNQSFSGKYKTSSLHTGRNTILVTKSEEPTLTQTLMSPYACTVYSRKLGLFSYSNNEFHAPKMQLISDALNLHGFIGQVTEANTELMNILIDIAYYTLEERKQEKSYTT